LAVHKTTQPSRSARANDIPGEQSPHV
jgi:hypothetical protein